MNDLIVCRRSNYVHAAYVEAAIKINTMFGSDRAYWILIREGVQASVIERVLQGSTERLRRKRSRFSAALCADPGRDPGQQEPRQRIDLLTAQRVEVALVFQSMLGTEPAAEYLRNAGVPVWITARVLGSNRRRPSEPLVIE